MDVIYDKETGKIMESPDMTKGYLVPATREIFHPAVEAVEEVTRTEVVKEYPNGGKDVKTVVVVEGVKGHEAYTEMVPCLEYVKFSAEELAEKLTDHERLKNLEESFETLKSGLGRLEKLFGGVRL